MQANGGAQNESAYSTSPSNKNVVAAVDRIRLELCEDSLPGRVEKWGPGNGEEKATPSWTGAITSKIGGVVHYMSCPGHLNSEPCAGYWCRRDRDTTTTGLHCVYGGWVSFDGDAVTEVCPPGTSDTTAPGARNLPRLRRMWAEHWLAKTTQVDKLGPVGIIDQDVLDRILSMITNKTADSEGSINRGDVQTEPKKKSGKGSGGWSGLAENGTVLKRDSGNRRVGNHLDRCDAEPGGMWRRGDAEMWMTAAGWSCLLTRDGRWRPAYHLEVLLSNLPVGVDYGPTRAGYRDWLAERMEATWWLWLKTPLDVPRCFADGIRSGVVEMFRREQRRRQDVQQDYVPDDASTAAKRYDLLQDRIGEFMGYHTVGEPMAEPRGLIASWAVAITNDIIDYERDVLCGETNNLVRSITSDQQVVDVSALILKALLWSITRHDYDLADAIVGSTAWFLVCWRYNGPKFARYEAISIRDRQPGLPPELEDVAAIVLPAAETGGSETYGQIYKIVEERVRTLYSGCTCLDRPEGHDAWELLAQACDEAGNDDVEERLHIAVVALNNGANSGRVGCECGLDLLLYEGFVRFFDPETGIVSRLHYRSDASLANVITE
ncbi:uncharacterized protein MAM_08266 [Metarhizium album ARSEF 1941]|uniref:Uncharacterized protein n=1 Tax=Metarhizium album (strain ARSEF 1941) TaxID=1081103 RepID=A0A0B2WDG9_METAS|nr:uncharacterized protein MAM_08266 [Metarhizium album ARSEF 1941]KHN93906.1 hypothetical protein MAM_08266 [Metarhizium album ARSEF 1941]